METHSESSLLVHLGARGDHAYEQFVQHYRSRVFAVVQRLLRNKDDAWHAVQDSFLAAFRAIDSFEDPAQFSTWLHHIASNAALMKPPTERDKREVPLKTRPSLHSGPSAGTANGASHANMASEGKAPVDLTR